MMTQRPGRAEWLFFVLAIVFLAEAVIPLLLHGAEVDVVLAPEGEPVLQVVSYGIYLVTAALFVRRLGSLLPLLARNWLLLAIALLAILSSLWSLDPALTLRRGGALLATTLFGVYLAARFPPPELLRLLAAAFGLCIVLSLGFVLLYPWFGLMHDIHEGAWRGAFLHKNAFGYMLVWAATVFWLVARARPARRWAWRAAALLAVLLLILSRSAAAAAALLMLPVAALTLWAGYAAGRAVFAAVAVLALLAAVPYVVSGGDIGLVFGLLGRDATLTGRVDMWDVLWPMVSDRLWLGWGYGVFWTDPRSPAVLLREIVGWYVPTAHNGWLDIVLNCGLVGLALVLCSFGAALRAAWRQVRRGDPDAFGLAIFLFLLFVTNVAESRLLQQNALPWVLYTATVVGLGRDRRQLALPRRVSDAPLTAAIPASTGTRA